MGNLKIKKTQFTTYNETITGASEVLDWGFIQIGQGYSTVLQNTIMYINIARKLAVLFMCFSPLSYLLYYLFLNALGLTYHLCMCFIYIC